MMSWTIKTGKLWDSQDDIKYETVLVAVGLDILVTDGPSCNRVATQKLAGTSGGGIRYNNEGGLQYHKCSFDWSR